jgi:putative nucleotidyltransferase with HDIG domain
MYLAKRCDGNCVKVASLSVGAGNAERDQGLLEAYLGVAVKRMFPSGTDAFSRYQHKFEQMKPLLDTITALAFAVEAKDPFTRGHSEEVSRLAEKIALQAGLSQAEIEDIRLAGIVHDIGKIHVPEYVLNKPTLLTAEEFETMKSHATWGAKILEPLKVIAIERIVRHHHECFDGQGYPEGLKGEQIPFGARIIAVADAFQAIVSARAYRKARTVQEALAELDRCRGSQFDPLAVDALVLSIKPPSGQQMPDSVESLLI